MKRMMVLAAMTVSLWGQNKDVDYCFGMLMAKAGRKDLPNEEAQKIQAGHMAHLNALGQKRWLVAAGPMVTPGNLRGLVISKCASVEEAKEMAAKDPAVAAGRLYLEVYGWKAPAGLGDRYWAERAADPGKKEKMERYPVAFLMKSVQWNGAPAGALVKEHLGYVEELMKSGKMKSRGHFDGGGTKAGVYLFGPVGMEEGRKLAEGDPMVKAGLLRVEMVEWYAADGTFPQ